MRIEHTALYVRDLEAEKKFFETYFGACAGARYHNPKTGFSSYFLSFDGKSRLEIMNVADLADGEERVTAGWAHLAFCVDSKEAVKALTARLATDGYRVVSGPRTTGDGYFESCVLDGEGNRIEITV